MAAAAAPAEATAGMQGGGSSDISMQQQQQQQRQAGGQAGRQAGAQRTLPSVQTGVGNSTRTSSASTVTFSTFLGLQQGREERTRPASGLEASCAGGTSKPCFHLT